MVADGTLVGRDGLVDELVAAADQAAGGAGSIILLTGEAGIGKTSLARVLARSVGDRLEVSWGACVADQSAPPFWPWSTLIPVDAPDGPSASGQAIGARRFERLTALTGEVRRAVAARPRLHVIEDLQWADVASVLLLVHLGAVVVDAPLLVVATLRTGEPRTRQLDEAIEEVRRSARVRDLPSLDDEDIATLMRVMGTDPDERLVALIRARTDGNPLFVSELLRTSAMADDVPARVSDLVLHRLGRLPPAVVDVLITASVIGAQGDVATLAAAHGADLVPLLDLVDQARAAHVLDAAPPGRWQFRHQLIRDAVYASVTASDRARRHAAAVEALAADPSTPPPAIAHHALAARPLFDTDRAVALAARAGESAFAQHAYEEAVDWFGRALAEAPPTTPPRWRAELLLLAGEAQRHIGEIGGAREAFLRAAAATDDAALLARAALGYADPGADLGIAYRTDDPVTAELLERAIAAQSEVDSPTTVQLEARLAAELYFSDDPGRAHLLAQSALDRARRLDDPRALGTATAVVHDAFVVGQAPMEEQLMESAQLLDWAATTGSVSGLLTAHRARVLDLLAAGDLTAMDAEVLAFRRLAEPLQAPGYLWWPALWSAMRALLEGRHDVAEERALAAYEIGAGSFPTLSFLNLSFLLFFLRREQGRLDEMEQAARDYAASHADVPSLRVALTLLLAELGRLDEARATLAGFDDGALALLHDRNWPASWFQLARAAHLADDVELARTLLEPGHRPAERCIQISLATVCLGATDLGAAWLFHTVGDLNQADAHYRSAQELNARIGAKSWLAQAQADHARLRPEPEAVVAASATFRRDGAVWELAYADRVTQLPDARGLHDLAHLLAHPGEAVSVLELAHDAEASPATDRGAPALDERARREIRARLHELDDDEADAEAAGDGERAALVREQRQELAEQVARDVGLGGRARRIGDPVERVRKTVSTRIRRSITAIGRAHPELGRHLERSIDTGAWCAYRPAEPIDWQT